MPRVKRPRIPLTIEYDADETVRVVRVPDEQSPSLAANCYKRKNGRFFRSFWHDRAYDDGSGKVSHLFSPEDYESVPRLIRRAQMPLLVQTIFTLGTRKEVSAFRTELSNLAETKYIAWRYGL